MSLTLAIAFSHHIGLAADYNEVHPSVRYTRDWFIAGAYLNSEGSVSPYVGARYDLGKAYIEAGIVGGYEYTAVAPYARAGYEITDHVSVFIAPAYEVPDRLGVVVGMEFAF
ncbi:hypothetical protein [Sulfitobacter sp.]|uniref:hypothetical protein n=1 Tax=Sulfitobacter sp. TaxID=1903071 RepID=UPI003F6B23B6